MNDGTRFGLARATTSWAEGRLVDVQAGGYKNNRITTLEPPVTNRTDSHIWLEVNHDLYFISSFAKVLFKEQLSTFRVSDSNNKNNIKLSLSLF